MTIEPQPPRPTLNDVAATSGVSRSTVSLVIRDDRQIPDGTKARVRQAMKDLGYVYNRGAASIRARRTRSIGLISPDSANPFMGEFTAAFEQSMLERGLLTVSCHTYEDLERQNDLVVALLERGVDAMAIMPAAGSEATLPALLEGMDIPLVTVVRPLPDDPVTFVGSDNTAGGRLVAEHLRDHGIRSMAYLGGDPRLTVRQDRINAVQKVCASSGIDFNVDVDGPPTGTGGREAMSRLIRTGAPIDGIICHNDTIAFGVFRAIRDEAPHLLERLRVVGFDDIAESALWEPRLTTMSVSARQIGETAASILTRKLDGAWDQSSVRSAPRLIIRDSCGDHPNLTEAPPAPDVPVA